MRIFKHDRCRSHVLCPHQCPISRDLTDHRDHRMGLYLQTVHGHVPARRSIMARCKTDSGSGGALTMAYIQVLPEFGLVADPLIGIITTAGESLSPVIEKV